MKKILAFLAAFAILSSCAVFPVQAAEDYDVVEAHNTYYSKYCTVDRNGIVYRSNEPPMPKNAAYPIENQILIDSPLRSAAEACPDNQFAVKFTIWIGDAAYDRIDEEVEQRRAVGNTLTTIIW